MEVEIWKTSLNFEAIYSCLNPAEKEIIDNMDDQTLEKFINDSAHAISKGFDWGLTFNWDTEAKTALELALDEWQTKSEV